MSGLLAAVLLATIVFVRVTPPEKMKRPPPTVVPEVPEAPDPEEPPILPKAPPPPRPLPNPPAAVEFA